MGLMCRVLGVSRSGYYAHQSRAVSRRASENAELIAQIEVIHKRSRNTYGSPRVHQQLLAEGTNISRGRVERLMRAKGICGKRKHKFCTTTDSKHDLPVADNVVDREFSVGEPDKVWVSDITYIPTGEGWLYLAGVVDLGTRAVVGWSMSESLERQLVMDALEMAYRRRHPQKGLIHHSDRGSQYASEGYRNLICGYGMQMSMSRRGNCWDNAVMESFFGTLKQELIYDRRYRTRAEARAEVFEYIEVFYNRQRLHSSLGYLSPADYHKKWAQRQAA